jgi:hypothetical protein
MGRRVVIASVLWDANDKSESWSRCYTDVWAERLFNGFRRNLTVPHRAVLFTDRERELPAWIEQIIDPGLGSNGYGDCVRPFALNEPMIFAGLDTLVVGECDKFARWCLETDRIALPRHPHQDVPINGIVLCPAGQRRIFDEWSGENDMEWMRRWPYHCINDLWPGKVVSWKAHVMGRKRIPPKTRIIYFHGEPKMHQLTAHPLVRLHWR